MGNAGLYASFKNLQSLSQIGIVGELNLGLLTLISLWRTVVLLRSAGPKDFQAKPFRKKLLLHILLLLGTAVDLPMYISFILMDQYEVATYAFHKLECAFIFTAYSITITDWSSVLYEINEDSHVPFLLKRGIVWTITAAVLIIALLNFIFCLAMNNLATYTETPIYIMGLLVQMGASLMLTCVMLHGGIKLAWRIRGASGHSGSAFSFPFVSLVATCSDLFTSLTSCCTSRGRGMWSDGDNSGALLVNTDTETVDGSVGGGGRPSSSINSLVTISPIKSNPAREGAGVTTQPRQQQQAPASGRSQDFLSALRCLNIVMATCASCEFIQMTLLFLNWLLGYAGSQQQTVGPTYFYWTFYAWFPLWGVVLSLLYLSSASSSSLRKRGPSDAQDLSHRLIDDDEMERSGAQGAGGGAGAYQGRSASGAEHNDVAEPSPGTSFNSGTYSYTYRGQSTSVSQLTSDVFFRDVAAAASARDYQ